MRPFAQSPPAASERAGHSDTVAYLRELGIDPVIHRGRQKGSDRPELEFDDRGVHYRLLDVGRRDMMSWQKIVGAQFDLLFDRTLLDFRPDILLAFGGLPQDVRRYQRARRQGTRLVFALRNLGYVNEAGRALLCDVDGILTPSRYLTDVYRRSIGIESTPLPLPHRTRRCRGARARVHLYHDQSFSGKGLMVMARLAEDLSLRRPDIPLLVIESRESGGRLVQAGMAGGFDLRRHENLMLSPPVGQPKEIYTATRALLAPSLMPEAAGRVAAEAILNGIPPMVSDRGGLPETCNGAGFTFQIPTEIAPNHPVPVSSEVVAPWVDMIVRLEGDEEFYGAESRKALEASAIYRPENLLPRYVEYFRTFLQ